MINRTKKQIEQAANQVLAKYNAIQQPFRYIRSICVAEGITLRHASLSDGVDGAFSVIGEQKAIFYNETKPRARQNFTKAHELGHCFLTHPLKDGMLICNMDKEDSEASPYEVEANYFASYFLMPESIVRKIFYDIAILQGRNPAYPLYVDTQPCNKFDWQRACTLYNMNLGVSKEALRYRLENLGLLQYNL